MSTSLLKKAWRAGRVSRLTLVLGLIASAVWAAAVALVTVKFIVDTIREPALPTAHKVVLLLVLVVAILFLVMFLPTQWLMYILLRLDERRRKDSDPKS
ncbi:MAG: hypothetical protein GWN68_04895 [Gemmatimonadetes bacterium]|nr:hypothetical protein [Gemmatimonadota bacterium]